MVVVTRYFYYYYFLISRVHPFKFHSFIHVHYYMLNELTICRYFGGIKLGTGGLVRAYGGVASECLRNAPTILVKSRVIKSFLRLFFFHRTNLCLCHILWLIFY